MDQLGNLPLTILHEESARLVAQHASALTPCHGDWIPLDIDVSPFDNSGTKKEGVAWTYKKLDGYAPNFAYLGQEGYLVHCELRPGNQHCQEGTPEFLDRTIELARQITPGKLLVRMDAGNDDSENLRHLRKKPQVDWIIKRNLRQESEADWLVEAQAYGHATVYEPDWSDTLEASAYESTTLYTGRELDLETGLYYYRARYYSAELGRFVGRDPIGYGAKDVNLYRYVGSAPAAKVDPDGLMGMLEPRIDWTGGWEPKPENKEVLDRLRNFDDRVQSCVQRCLEASGTKWAISIALGVTPVVSLPLKPPGVHHLGAPTPTWSTLLRKLGGTSCRVTSRRLNPAANILFVAGVCYSMGNAAGCKCECSKNPAAF
jgi:RHS repeat-associated protein